MTIYKAVCRNVDCRGLKDKTYDVGLHRNILIYKTMHTHVLRQFPFINHNIENPLVPPRTVFL